jgi:thioredoxin-like negative regulator of GroEL
MTAPAERSPGGDPAALSAARADAAAGRWKEAFDRLQLVLEEVRATGDARTERELLAEMREWLERSGHPARAALVRRYLERGFRSPLGYDGPLAHEAP